MQLPPQANGPASWKADGLSVEQIEADLRAQDSVESQQAYLEALAAERPELVDAWAGWKKSVGQTAEVAASDAPSVIPNTNTRMAQPRRMPYAAANQAMVDQVPEEVDPQQLAQMESMKAAAQAANGQPASEPTPVEGPGMLGGDLGMYLRAAAQGATALPALPINLMTSLMPYGGDGDVVGTMMDAAGAKRPQSRDDRITSDIIAGLTGSGAVMAGGKMLGKMGMKEAGERLSAAPAAQLIGGGAGGAASGVVREEGGSQEQQILAALIAGNIPSGISSATKEGFTRGVDPAMMAQTLDNFQTGGTTPTVGQLTQGNKAQAVESFLSQFYGSGNQMKNVLSKQEDAVVAANLKKADEIGPIELMPDGSTRPTTLAADELGDLIEDTWISKGKPAIAAKRQELQQAVSDEINPRLATPLPKFQGIVDELAKANPDLGPLGTNKTINPNFGEYAELKKDLKTTLKMSMDKQLLAGIPESQVKEALPFEAVRELKTKIGANMDASIFGAKDIPQAEYRRMTGAISNDVKDFVKSQGVDAAAAFDEMNTWERNYHRQASYLKKVLDTNGGPERVFDAAFASAKKGPTILNSVYNNMDENTKKMLTSAFIYRMGKSSSKTNPDDFDLAQMFGNFNDLPKASKETIFGQMGGTYLRDMQKLNEAARTILKSEKEFGMRASGRAGNLGIQTVLYAPALLTAGGSYASGEEGMSPIVKAFLVMGGTVGGAKLGAHYLTNPKTVKWLASNSKLPPAAVPTAINLLAQEARKSQDPDMIEFARLMEEASTPDDGDK
jgi:hypothetical protein